MLISNREDYNLMDVTYEDLMDLLLRIYCHHQLILRKDGDEPERSTGVGLYPASPFIKAVKDPDDANCEHYFDYNANLVVKTKRPVFIGERITIGEEPTFLN